MSAVDYKRINEAVKNGDFTEFDKLSEAHQKSCKSAWNQDEWLKFMIREKAISEEDLYQELYDIIDKFDK